MQDDVERLEKANELLEESVKVSQGKTLFAYLSYTNLPILNNNTWMSHDLQDFQHQILNIQILPFN